MNIKFRVDGEQAIALSVAALFVVSLVAFTGGSVAYYNYSQGLCDRGYTSVQAGENVRFLVALSPQYLDLGYPGASSWGDDETAAEAHLWTALKADGGREPRRRRAVRWRDRQTPDPPPSAY